MNLHDLTRQKENQVALLELLSDLWETLLHCLKPASAYLKSFNTPFKEEEQCRLSKIILRFCYEVLSCFYACLDI